MADGSWESEHRSKDSLHHQPSAINHQIRSSINTGMRSHRVMT